MEKEKIQKYAAECEKQFASVMAEYGYERKTTFFSDLSIAECDSEKAILDTYKRVMKEWLDDIEHITEFCICLNHKIWQHYENGNEPLARIYDRLWKECDAHIIEHYRNNEEGLSYFYRTTD